MRLLTFYLSIIIGSRTYKSADEVFINSKSYDTCLTNEYVKKYNYALEVKDPQECAALCALGCKNTCDSFIIEGNQCRFAMFSETDFGQNTKSCQTNEPISDTKVIKKSGTILFCLHRFWL